MAVRTRSRRLEYRILIDRDLLPSVGEIARDSLFRQDNRILIVSNRTVFQLYGKTVESSLRRAGFSVTKLMVADGERFKTLTTLQKILRCLSDNKYERSDAILALGGGIVGDLAGFAAGIYVRGIPFINAPTTLLAQIDSSVGGKTGVNFSTGKNLVGVFHQPAAVIADILTLQTLPRRELTSGFCEMVKQGAIASRKLFEQTAGVLVSLKSMPKTLVSNAMEHLIAEHCRFKASIVTGDEREDLEKNDTRSRKILNFGHTTGHALETATKYQHFRHGEAVGIGVIVAAIISHRIGLLPTSEMGRLSEVVKLCGPLPDTKGIDEAAVLSAMNRDKKQIKGETHWVLLERIGQPRIVKSSDIPPSVLRLSLREGLATAAELRS